MASLKNTHKRASNKNKMTRQGNGANSKFPHKKGGKLYRKRYNGQGK